MKESIGFLLFILFFSLWVFSDAVGRLVLRILTTQPSL
jgi:hypothetical protein